MKQFNLLMLFFLSSSLTFAQSFEGIVKVNIQETIRIPNLKDSLKQSKKNIIFQIKGDLSHFIVTDETENDKITYITNKSTGDVIKIMRIVDQDFVSLKNYKNGMNKDYFPKKIITIESVTKTGKSKNINGYVCYEYDIKIEDGNSTAWATPDLKLDLTEQIPFPTRMIISKKIKGIDGFIMEMTSNKEDGNSFIWTTTFEKKVINDSVFVPKLNPYAQNQLDTQRKSMKFLEDLERKLKDAKGDKEKLKKIRKEVLEEGKKMKN